MWSSEEGQAEEVEHTEIRDLDAQFAQQHQAMDQMRQMLAARDQQQAARLRQAQAYATRLTEIKSRAKASKRSMSGEAEETDSRDGGSEKKMCEAEVTFEPDREKESEKQSGFSKKSDKFRHGNLSLLRRQMEENRIKFEQRGKEMTENKRGIEEMLTQLKRQLDERDQIIRGLQQQKTVPDTHLESTPETAVHVVESVPASQESQRLQETLEERDTTIVQLNIRVQELEASVFELQENLREKDSVIEARTKAIALLSEDLSKRSKTTLDTLDETRQQMRLMQQNFVALEARMKEEKDRLNSDIEAKDKRLAESEQSIAQLEAVRFDLSTRNAALQEKVVRLQELSAELRGQHDAATQRAEELSASLEEANKQAIRAKAQFGNKVKTLRKQLDSLNKVTDVNEEISKLQNRIAELEEEKGNLQLHLVDFDELKVSEAGLKQQVAELEERAQQASHDLDSHVHVISLLEAEKLDLLQGGQEYVQRISSLVAENTELKNNLSSLENQKVMLEMKAVELEEQLDMVLKEKMELSAEVTAITQQLSAGVQGPEEKFEIMELTRAPGVEKMETQKSDDHVGKNEKDSSNLEMVLRSLENELSEARRVLEEQKAIILDLNMKLDSKEEELELQREMIFKLEQLSSVDNRAEEENGNKISDILKDVGDMAADLEEWKTRCTEVEERLRVLETEKLGLETRFEEVRSENRSLSTMLQEQKNTSDQLMDKLKEQNEGICARDTNILKLQALIEENGHVLKERESALQEVNRLLVEVQENFKNRCSALEVRFQEKHAELELKKSSVSELENVLTGKDNELMYLKTELDERQHQLDRLESEQRIVKENLELHFQDKIHALSEQLKQMSTTNQQLLQNIDDLKNDIHEKNKYIEKLEIGIKNSEEVEKHLEVTSDTLNKISNELESVKHELNVKCLEYSEVARKLEETELQSKEKTEKMKRLTANLKAKALALRTSEDKLKQLESTIETNDSALSELNEKLAYYMEKASHVTELENTLKEQAEQLLQVKSQYEDQSEMLHAKETEIFALSLEISELKQAVKKVEGEKAYEEKSALVENEISVLKMKLDDREREIELLRAEQVELLRKCSDAEHKNLELVSKLNELDHRNKSLEESMNKDMKRVAELEDEMESKDIDYMEAMGKVEGLQDVISEQKLQYNKNVASSKKDSDVMGRDMKIVELEEQISTIQERYQQTWSASEAKLQEREAVVESLELDLSRSQERVHSLENAISEMGDRQGFLESSMVTLEQQLEEAKGRLQEEEERRQLVELELSRFAGIETSSRQKMEEAMEKKAELESSLKEMVVERGELLKRITNLENSSRETLNELERLSEFESAFNEESVRVQALMMQQRQQAVEMEGKARELKESKQYCESLESDVRTCQEQLEELEIERRNWIEKEEKLLAKLMQVEENLTCASDEWEGKINDQNIQIMELQKEKEKLTDSLQNKLENIQCNTNEAAEDIEEFRRQISDLNIQLKDLKAVIAQKEEEVKTYQTRLLQLQFGSQDPLSRDAENSSQNRISELETVNADLLRRTAEYDKNIFDLQEQLLHARVDLEGAYSKLNHSTEETNMLTEKVGILQGELKSKSVDLQELWDKYHDMMDNLKDESAHVDCEKKLADLQHEKDQLLTQLLCEKATSEVQNIITLAEERVRSRNNDEEVEGSNINENVEMKHLDDVAAESSSPSFVHLEEQTNVSHPKEPVKQSEASFAALQDLLVCSARIQELETQVLQLQHDLSVAERERSDAVTRVQELEVQSKETEKITFLTTEPIPVVEEVCVQKSAYLTYQPDEMSSSVGQDLGDTENAAVISSQSENFQNITFFQEQPNLPFNVTVEPVALEDEPWGWGTDEAMLEEEHLKQKQQQQVMAAPAVEPSLRLEALEKELQILAAEKKVLEEEAKSTQSRCDKLLQKLKEVKIKNDNLMKENLYLSKQNMSGFGDLDSAIEEEFKIRIDALEKNTKELTAELDAARLERESLLKQIDVLTSANSKILEVKEKQDMDLDIWQKRFKDISNTKEAVDWIVEELTEENKTLMFKVAELESELNVLRAEKAVNVTEGNSIQENVQFELQDLREQLTALAADNEHLQTLLEAQRNMRVKAEADLSRHAENFSVAEIQSRNEVASENLSLAVVNLRHEKEVMAQEFEKLSLELASVQSSYEKLMSSHSTSDTNRKENTSETKTCNRCDSLQKQYEEVIDSLTKEMSDVGRQYDVKMKENMVLIRQLEVAQRNLEELCEKCEKLAMKWLRSSVNVEEETLAILQLRDEVKTAVQQLKDGGQETVVDEAASNFMLLRKDGSECVIAQLREGLEKKTADVESLTEAIGFKNEEIKHLQASIASQEEKVLQLQQQLRRVNVEGGEDRGQYKGDSEGVGSRLDERLVAREEGEERRLMQELVQKEREVENLRQEAAEVEMMMLVKDEDMQSLRVQLAEKSQKLEEVLEAREREVHELRQQQGEAARTRDTEERELRRQLGEVAEAKERVEHELRQLQEEVRVLRERLSAPGDAESSEQSELDLALYMLHQRDVRCDELTLELMQLLEERDTLQLRLSNSLRANEELRSKTKSLASSGDLAVEAPDSTQNLMSRDQVIGEPAVEEREENLQELDTKLSQLHSVGYRRDVTFQDEQEHRHSAQVRLLQRRGPGIVVDANYTLSRDVQPPSTVLLNWIRGRSTPRVMHV